MKLAFKWDRELLTQFFSIAISNGESITETCNKHALKVNGKIIRVKYSHIYSYANKLNMLKELKDINAKAKDKTRQNLPKAEIVSIDWREKKDADQDHKLN